MGCGGSSQAEAARVKPEPEAKPQVKPEAKPEAKPEGEQELFKAELWEWWSAEGKSSLRAVIEKTAEDFQGPTLGEARPSTHSGLQEHWADFHINFIEQSLKGLDFVKKDSARAKEITTKDEYIADYKKKIVGREEKIDPANLYNIKREADEAFASGADNPEVIKNNPKLAALLRAFMKEREVFYWSQGSFGPQSLDVEFLKQYANTMLSGSIWTQPEETFEPVFSGKGNQFLEAGIFYVREGTEYPLHYHETLECYFVLWGETRFVWLIDEKLVYQTKKVGEWIFMPPWVPHAIVTPNQPLLTLWFREGGMGQKANNKFGPKWIGDVDGLEVLSIDEAAQHENYCNSIATGEVQRHVSDKELVGSLGLKPGSVSTADDQMFFRMLTPSQWENIENNPDVLQTINEHLTPERKAAFEKTVAGLKEHSHGAQKPTSAS